MSALQLEIIEDGSVVVGHDGRIVAVGSTKQVLDQVRGKTFDREIDCTGQSVIPGLIDGHTHPVWSGDRTHEFAMKLGMYCTVLCCAVLYMA